MYLCYCRLPTAYMAKILNFAVLFAHMATLICTVHERKEEGQLDEYGVQYVSEFGHQWVPEDWTETTSVCVKHGHFSHGDTSC